MRKTLIAIAIGLTALATAACGGSGSGTDSDVSQEPLASDPALQSMDPALESPSDMLLPSDSPASS
jgi:ABC-type glycerol-3-phosphate transport system substrate-binding protein